MSAAQIAALAPQRRVDERGRVDFAGLEYVNIYRSMPAPADYGVEFIDYDWTVASRSAP